jgi:dimethylargininase
MPTSAAPVAITRRPGPELARCELTHLARTGIDLARAAAQHERFRATLVELGCLLVDLESLAEHPDAPFVEDVAVVLDDLAILPTPGASSRRGESASIAAVLREWRRTERLEAGTLDGGDVLVHGTTLYVGRSSRTSHAALRALAHLVLPHGYRVKAVEVSGILHLKSALTLLDEATALVSRRALNLERVRDLELVDVHPAEPRAACVLRAGDALIVSASFPRTGEILARRGGNVIALELDEFEKAEAGPTCLALLFDR